MIHSFIYTSGLSYYYNEAGQRHCVLDGIDLTINKGEIIALLGASGSGKSTLLNLLGGIDQAHSGSVHIAGHNFNTLTEPALTHFRREHIGFIYQLFNLIPTLSVAENIALPLELSGIASMERQQQVRAWLKKVDLTGREQAFPDQLSGGEQQRVAIARALIHQPALVLADEPTGNLDAVSGYNILELLTTLAREQRQTLVIVTHSQTVANAADRILLMQAGKLVQIDQQTGKQTAW